MRGDGAEENSPPPSPNATALQPAWPAAKGLCDLMAPRLTRALEDLTVPHYDREVCFVAHKRADAALGKHQRGRAPKIYL